MSVDLLLIRPNDQKEIYTNTIQFTACEPPYWSALIAAYVREKGITVKILDAEALDQSPEKTIQDIELIAPKVVGIIVTGTNLSASTQKMKGAGTLANLYQRMGKEAYTFMWGLHPSALTQQTLVEESVDCVIKGENLNSILELVAEIKSSGEITTKIKGACYRKNNRFIMNDEIELANLAELPSPAWDLLDMKSYVAHNWQRMGEEKRTGYGIIATSLGCPFSCEFCAVSSLFGQRKVRFKPVEKVVAEIEELVAHYQIHFIKILDECFVLDKEYVHQLCDELCKKQWDLNIWAYARVDTVDAKILKKLYTAGIRWIAYGIESPRKEVLSGVAKSQYTDQDIVEVMQKTREAGIHVIANFMFGLPDDSLESMEETLQFAKKLNPEYVNFNCTMAYPGSKLYYDIVHKSPGALSNNWLEYAQLSYECKPLSTKYLTAKEVLQFRDEAFYRFFENNEAYFNNIEQKFGIEAVQMIKRVLEKKLKRKLLE